MTQSNIAEFVRNLQQYGDRSALVMRLFLRTERLSYLQLRDRAYQAAHFLAEQGLKKGDRLMIVAPNSPTWVALFLGAQLRGIIVVPVDAQSNSHTVGTFIDQTSPKLLCNGSTSRFPAVTTLRLADIAQQLDAQPVTPPTTKVSGSDPAVIVFTSGTTAAPKGVVLTQANILANVKGIGQMLAIKPEWRFLSVLPLSHMYELSVGCLTLLWGGCSVHYVARMTPLAITQALKRYKITSILAVPQVLELFLQRIRQRVEAQGKTGTFARALQLASALPRPLQRQLFRSVHKELGGKLAFVVTGGAPIPPDIAITWERMGVQLLQGYGLTETSPVLTMNTFKQRRLDSQGLVLPNVHLRLGKDNDIQAKGPSVFSEYWHNKTATQQAFTHDGWFKTGDVGSLANGWLRIRGRAKFAIVLPSGLKVFPEDIEVVAEKQPAWQEVCIVGLNSAAGESVHAVITSKASNADIEHTISTVNAQLESFQHITSWARWPDAKFPRTRLLKIDRKTVQNWANQVVGSKDNHTANGDGDDILLNILRTALDNRHLKVAPTDKLADIGLDSLRRLTVVSLIEEQLGITLPESHITQHTTMEQLRHLIKNGDKAEPDQHRPEWPYHRATRLIGNLLRETLLRGILRIWVKANVRGRTNLTHLKTPAIFIFNHVDGFDGPVVFNALPWHIRRRLTIAIADDVMREHPVLNNVPRLCYGGFNLKRKDPVLPSLEYVGELIDKGFNVALAPEGHVSHTGKLDPFKSGIGLLAVELGVPIVAVKIEGLHGTVPIFRNKHLPQKRSRINVRISKPITFSRFTNYDDATHKLEHIMRQL